MIPRLPTRRVVRAEALAWLAEHPATEDMSVVTSLPDLSELAGATLESFRAWFVEAARHVIRWIPREGAAIFFQSDVHHHGTWIDKGHLIASAMEAEGASLVWHKIVCRSPPDTATAGRPSYSHMLCVSRQAGRRERHRSPDVLSDAGFSPWSKGMGVNACRLACRFLLDETATRVVLDPFCGHGTVLAVANALGLDALGVDKSARQCREARRLVVELSQESSARR